MVLAVWYAPSTSVLGNLVNHPDVYIGSVRELDFYFYPKKCMGDFSNLGYKSFNIFVGLLLSKHYQQNLQSVGLHHLSMHYDHFHCKCHTKMVVVELQ